MFIALSSSSRLGAIFTTLHSLNLDFIRYLLSENHLILSLFFGI